MRIWYGSVKWKVFLRTSGILSSAVKPYSTLERSIISRSGLTFSGGRHASAVWMTLSSPFELNFTIVPTPSLDRGGMKGEHRYCSKYCSNWEGHPSVIL